MERSTGKWKISLKANKWRCIATAAVLALFMALGVNAQANLFLMAAGAAAFFLISSIEVRPPEEFHSGKGWKLLATALILFLSAYFTMRVVQYLLVEPWNAGRMSGKNTWLNVLCCLFVMMVLYVITASARLAAMIGHGALMVLAFIDYFVYQFRGNEFSFGDVKAAGTGLSVASGYDFVLKKRAVYTIVLIVLFYALVRRLKIKLETRLSVLFRLGGLAACFVLFTRVAVQSETIVMESWEQKGTYRNGYILNFALSVRDSFVSKPDGYTKETIEALEDDYGETKQEDSKDDPTIIVVMNESFADLSTIGELKTTSEVTPFLNSLTENTVRGYALSSVYSAKTPNSEWEFLTGNSMAFLPSGSVAYQQYMSEEPYSLVSALKERGYTCLAMHPYFSTGWSRNKVYPLLGFEEAHFIDYFNRFHILRSYITDEELYDKIINRFEQKEDGEKLFIMSVTMQNHGGYTNRYPNFTNSILFDDGFYSDVNQYLSLIHESDRALEELIHYFESVDEKVEIVFFGDHQPGLSNEFYLKMNGKGLSGLSLDELEDLFTVPFFIWTNYESKEQEVEMTSLNYLSTMTLEKAGIALPPYQRFLKDLMEYVPAMNSRAYYSAAQGGYRHYENDENMPEEQWLKEYEILQYNNMFDKNKSEVFFPYYDGDDEERSHIISSED